MVYLNVYIITLNCFQLYPPIRKKPWLNSYLIFPDKTLENSVGLWSFESFKQNLLIFVTKSWKIFTYDLLYSVFSIIHLAPYTLWYSVWTLWAATLIPFECSLHGYTCTYSAINSNNYIPIYWLWGFTSWNSCCRGDY